MRKVIASLKVTDTVGLIKRIQEIGQRLAEAQPREIAVSNIVRRVLGVIREETEGDAGADTSSIAGDDSNPQTPKKEAPNQVQQGVAYPFLNDMSLDVRIDSRPSHADTEATHRPPLLTSHTSYAGPIAGPTVTSMFSLLTHPHSSSTSTPGTQSPAGVGSPRPSLPNAATLTTFKDLRAEVVEGIDEIIDEITIVDDQIASYALEHIHSNEIILTHASSLTVQKFLLKAASKRKFTVIHAEGFPNTHRDTHSIITGKNAAQNNSDADYSEDDLGTDRFSKPLIAAGIAVVLIPDAAVFALMSRVNKVILGTHIVLANGGLIAAAGAKPIAKAAREHRTPVVVVTGVYKLSPTYPFDFDALIEHGEPGPVLGWDEDGAFVEKVDVENPLHDYVPGELVDLYVTNLGGHAPFSLASVVEEQYRSEDTNLATMD
ncbi:MAG: hypothetical protein LQ340_007421 [Diploschistes diacapsis]|nr:MAG: hypothetical protein LQ340_007421 [Diploschistes diacapsis]